MSADPSRRAVLLGGAGLALAACSSEQERASSGAGSLVDGAFVSVAMDGGSVGWSIGYPAGHRPGARLPVVVSLHGRGASHRTTFTTLGLGGVLDRLVAGGVGPFALASVDGGDHGYWHRRADGTDPGAMVVDEFVPMLRDRGLDTDRLGLYGWSMGGYGALLLAGRRRLPVRALAVASPALFAAAGSTPPGAFDSAADFARHDVYGRPDLLDGVALRVDCGRSDPFYSATRDFVDRLPQRPAGRFGPGEHTAAYWRRVAPAELAFLGRHLGTH